MSLSDKQKAFFRRKMKTRFERMDIDKNGYLSIEDYNELTKRFIEYGKLSGEDEQRIHKAMQDICTKIGMKEGVKITLEQYWTGVLEMPAEERKIKSISLFSQWFDVVDTNGDGAISPREFGVYFKIMGIDESSTQACFDAIDTNHDGMISRDEFVAAGVDFFTGVDETSIGTLFFGPLVD